MLKKGEIKNLGPLSIVMPDSKSYKTGDDTLHLLMLNGMTFKEAFENAKYKYPGWRLPTINECQYINSLNYIGPGGKGIVELPFNFYWTSEDYSSALAFVYKPNYLAGVGRFSQMLKEEKVKVLYVKDSLI